MQKPTALGRGGRKSQLRLERPLLSSMAEERLRELISSGELAVGQRLPTEPQLAAELGIARSTLREALAGLAREGILARGQAGTIVRARPPVVRGLELLISVETLAVEKGFECRSDVLRFEEDVATPPIAARLQIKPGDPILAIREHKVLRERGPVGVLDQYVPAALIPLSTLKEHYQGSLLDALGELDEPRLSFARATVKARLATEELAAKLGVSPGAPLLCLQQTIYAEDERVMSYGDLMFRDDWLDFTVLRRRRLVRQDG